MTWRLYALVSGGAFLATYLLSTPATAPRANQSAAPQPSVRRTPDEVGIEELAARLQARVSAQASYREPGRDPFHFVAPQAREVNSPKPQAQAVEAPVVRVLPVITLAGIATDQIDGVEQRTAVLSTPAGILMVREGESVAGLYVVVKIDEESIELEATADASRRTLRFSAR
jgi:hypothetical protein